MSSRFIDSLLSADRPLIMEVKRRDAHGNDLFEGRSVADVVADFEAVGSPCISVVTGRWFGGTGDMLREVVEATDRPVLQKDFITRRDQLHSAKSLGASAVLLTAALLPESSMGTLVTTALSLGLTPFVEVTTEHEIAAVPEADACVMAVNNKDITAKERDLGDVERSLGLLPNLERSGTRCPVSASGIDRPEVAARLLGAGFAGLLIGTSLLRSHSLPDWLAAFDEARRAGAAESLSPLPPA
ncbi:beta/alpha barrel domain-containing protein [Salinactinospora qingdaonensis]|uniref:indole-3-glycerol-phosphate synthase n=1 Tax=Salinactinospora qingdaonensis TaxID=702744 RepID=A0ABP7EVU8_9ACTN